MKFLLSILLFLTISVSSYSQYKGGMELGANIMQANFTLTDLIETKSTIGIRMGYVVEYGMTDNFFLRSGILINQRGFQFADERWGLNALEVPVNIAYAVSLNDKSMKWFIDGGLNLEYNFHAFTKIDDELVELSIGNKEDDIKSFSTGINIGTGLQFSESIKVRIDYYSGLTNLMRTENDEWVNNNYGLAFMYFFKKK